MKTPDNNQNGLEVTVNTRGQYHIPPAEGNLTSIIGTYAMPLLLYHLNDNCHHVTLTHYVGCDIDALVN